MRLTWDYLTMNPLTTDPCHVVARHIDDPDTLMHLGRVNRWIRRVVERRIHTDLEHMREYTSWIDPDVFAILKEYRVFINPDLYEICGRLGRTGIKATHWDPNYLKKRPEIAFYLPLLRRVCARLIFWWEISNDSHSHYSFGTVRDWLRWAEMKTFNTEYFSLRSLNELSLLTSLKLSPMIADYQGLTHYLPRLSNLRELTLATHRTSKYSADFSALTSLTKLSFTCGVFKDGYSLPPNLETLIYDSNHLVNGSPLTLRNYNQLRTVSIKSHLDHTHLADLPSLRMITLSHTVRTTLSNLPELTHLKLTCYVDLPRCIELDIEETPKLTKVSGDRFVFDVHKLRLKETPALTEFPRSCIHHSLIIEGRCGLRQLTLSHYNPINTLTLPRGSKLTFSLKGCSYGHWVPFDHYLSKVYKIDVCPGKDFNLAQIGKFTNLTTLKLVRPRLISFDDDIRTAASFDFLHHLPQLTKLSICSFIIQGFPKAICTLTRLEYLSLSDSTFNRKKRLVLPETFTCLQQLKCLNLSRTGLRGTLTPITNIPTLLAIDLSGNYRPELTDALLQLPQLKELRLWDCRYETIPPFLVHLHSTVEISW